MRFVYRKQDMASLPQAEASCWLLANGLGGFASASAAFSVTRGDQGLLLAARSPNRRYNLVHRLSETLDAGAGPVFLSSQRFAGGAADEDGYRRLEQFVFDGLPCWQYEAQGVLVTRRCMGPTPPRRSIPWKTGRMRPARCASVRCSSSPPRGIPPSGHGHWNTRTGPSGAGRWWFT